jgi:fatty acid desaturase
MEQIKWIKPNIENFYGFYERSNLKASLYIGFYVVLLSFTGGMTYYFFMNNSYILGILMIFFHGTFFSFLGWSGIGHELIHNSVFKTKILNIFFLRVVSFLTWNNYIYFEESHKRHHNYTLFSELDREIVLPLSPGYSQWIFLFTFNIPFFLKNLKALFENSIGKINGIWGNELFPAEEKEKRRKLFNFARLILLGQFSLIIFFIFIENYFFLLIITFPPFIANWLNRMMAISQHIHMKGNSNDFRDNSTTIRLNWFLSALYSNMNYHIEHHLYPQIPFYNLPLLSKNLEDFLPKPIVGFSNVLKHIMNKEKAKNDFR